MDDKNLDKLFRDKFKAFREVPDEKVWTAIDRSLDKKRRKRVIPLWWQLGGVAAILAIALVIFFPMDDSFNETPTVTDTEQKDADRSEDPSDDPVYQKGSDADEPDASETTDIDPANQNAAVVDGDDGSDTNKEQRQSNKKDVQKNENRLMEDQKRQQEDRKQRLEKGLRISTTTEEAVAGSSKDASRQKNASSQDNVGQEEAGQGAAVNRLSQAQVTANEENDRKKDAPDILKPSKPSKILSPSRPSPENLAQNDETNPERREGQADEEVNMDKRNSSYELLEGQTEGQMTEGKPESLPDANKEKADESADINKKPLLEIFEEQSDNEELAETSRSRWSAGPSIAPVYFNAMGEGSPIDPGFAANGKSGNTNFSYGLSVAYAVTDKLSVRSGIHKIDYGYDTNNVGFSATSSAFSSGRLQNVDYSGGAENLAVSDAATGAESPNSAAPEFSSLNATREGTVAQQFGYLEVPVELDYTLINGKFGVNLLGGISSLFLIDNSVTLNSGDLSTNIGEASNLNDLNFSTNIGFGINYKVTPTIRLNVEPVFKYQLNTFSNAAGDFRPYSIGIYSGLNFRF
ncbi:MAG: hypothetical protein WA913_01010 [Pricia sp.]